jgi:hypothetical protein
MAGCLTAISSRLRSWFCYSHTKDAPPLVAALGLGATWHHDHGIEVMRMEMKTARNIKFLFLIPILILVLII